MITLVDGFDQVIADFNDRTTERYLAAADQLLEELQEAAPVNTGFLRDSISIEITDLGSEQLTLTVLVEADYADDLNFGTRPHPIEGRPVLRFQWPDAPAGLEPDEDGFFYFRSVNHPGSTKHVGWFDDVMARWPEILEAQL